MKIKTIMSDIPTLEWLVYWTNILVIAALALSFLSGGASIIFGRWLSVAKDAQAVREKQISDENIALANKKAEEAQLARVELEKQLLPRIITFEIRGDGTTNFDNLKPFTATQVIIKYLPDAEPRRTAGEIRKLLEFAGWDILETGLISEQDELIEGIHLQYQEDIGRGLSKAHEAAMALKNFLELQSIKTHAFRAFTSDNLPPNSVRILIGLRPDPRIKSEIEKEIEDRLKRLNKPPEK